MEIIITDTLWTHCAALPTELDDNFLLPDTIISSLIFFICLMQFFGEIDALSYFKINTFMFLGFKTIYT